MRRVVREDGTLWLNIGDGYYSGSPSESPEGWHLKPKDLIGIPWEAAKAARAEGWYVRNAGIWRKSNSLPESVGDRLTVSYEYLFLLANSARYFFDLEPLRVPHLSAPQRRHASAVGHTGTNTPSGASEGHTAPAAASGECLSDGESPGRPSHRLSGRHLRDEPGIDGHPGGRAPRDVWSVPTYPSVWPSGIEPHYAVMPRAIAAPCIQASTSEGGVCPVCATPYRRVVSRERVPMRAERSREADSLDTAHGRDGRSGKRYLLHTRSRGFEPGCNCDEREEGTQPIPATVLDPFAGAATTALVSRELGRYFRGFELDVGVLPLVERRLSQQALMTVAGISTRSPEERIGGDHSAASSELDLEHPSLF